MEESSFPLVKLLSGAECWKAASLYLRSSCWVERPKWGDMKVLLFCCDSRSTSLLMCCKSAALYSLHFLFLACPPCPPDFSFYHTALLVEDKLSLSVLLLKGCPAVLPCLTFPNTHSSSVTHCWLTQPGACRRWGMKGSHTVWRLLQSSSLHRQEPLGKIVLLSSFRSVAERTLGEIGLMHRYGIPKLLE